MSVQLAALDSAAIAADSLTCKVCAMLATTAVDAPMDSSAEEADTSDDEGASLSRANYAG